MYKLRMYVHKTLHTKTYSTGLPNFFVTVARYITHTDTLKGIETRLYLKYVFHVYIKIKYVCNI